MRLYHYHRSDISFAQNRDELDRAPSDEEAYVSLVRTEVRSAYVSVTASIMSRHHNEYLANPRFLHSCSICCLFLPMPSKRSTLATAPTYPTSSSVR